MTQRPPLSYLALFVVSLANCVADESETAPPEPHDEFEHPDPTPYDPGYAPDISATLSPEQAGELIPSLVRLAAAIDPNGILAAYNSLFAHSDATCPVPEVIVSPDGQETNTIRGNLCLSGDETLFKGSIQLNEYARLFEDGSTEDGFMLTTQGGSFEIIVADGSYMRGALTLISSLYTYPDGTRVWAVSLTSDMSADIFTAGANPWLTGGLRGSFSVNAAAYGGVRSLQCLGTVSVPSDLGIGAFAIGNLALDGIACPLNTLGAVSLRDFQGAWHDAVFSSEEESASGLSCDACGDLLFYQEPLGTFCSDEQLLSGLLAWEETPW